jgi:hypothetical protein
MSPCVGCSLNHGNAYENHSKAYDGQAMQLKRVQGPTIDVLISMLSDVDREFRTPLNRLTVLTDRNYLRTTLGMLDRID